MIPTISRHVWFFPGSEHAFTMKRLDDQPLHAVVIYVRSPQRVDLAITDHDGVQHVARNVVLHQGDGDIPSGSRAEWMPYQRYAAAAQAAPVATKFAIGDPVTGAIAQQAEASAELSKVLSSSEGPTTTPNEGDPS